jgi:exodeoxyribonuclease III
MRIVSWNVNGLRACCRKGFVRWLHGSGADVVGLQEVRAVDDQVQAPLRRVRDFAHRHVVAAARPGYSGVALLAKRAPDEVQTSLGDARFDDEGRYQRARFGKLVVVNAYFPNGNGKDRDNSRIPYKLAFYRRVFDALRADVERGAPILVMGDFNTAHEDIDLARPKQNAGTSGFTTIERDALRALLAEGWVDTFRRFEPGPGHYSWWSQRVGVRAKNIGWRIDLALASPGLAPHVRGAFIQARVKGSDHAPIGVDIDDAAVDSSA